MLPISLNWFKSKKRKELEAIEQENIKLQNKLLKKQLSDGTKDSEEPQVVQQEVKHYKSAKMVNDMITLVLNDGVVLTKTNSDYETFERLRNVKSESEIFDIIDETEGNKEPSSISTHKNELKEYRKLEEGISLLEQVDDFVSDGKSICLKEANRSIPKLLIKKFSEIISSYEIDGKVDLKGLYADDTYIGLKRFFLWCCGNPRIEVANLLYDFLQKNSFRITKQGFFVALRNVVQVSTDTSKIDFISNAYQKIKAVWKKKPSNFVVYKQDGEYKFTDKSKVPSKGFQDKNREVIGNLQELYDKLPEMEDNRYTDDWTRTFDIRVGKVVSMPPEECNWSTQDCAASGLHFTSNEINYVGCGQTSMLILINPMKIVGIGEKKGRCYEYLPIMTVPREESTKILHDLDFDTLELDESYVISQLDNLREVVKKGFEAESTKHEFNIPNISSLEVDNIIDTLSEMSETLSKRVVKID